MLRAWMYAFSDTGETGLNDCKKDFPTTTHVIKILFSGKVTKDGYHPFVPSDTSFFTINYTPPSISTLLWSKFIGIADTGTGDLYKTYPQIYEHDGDSYLDLCIALTNTDTVTDLYSLKLN